MTGEEIQQKRRNEQGADIEKERGGDSVEAKVTLVYLVTYIYISFVDSCG